MAEQSCNGGFGEKRKAHEPVSPHDSKRGTYYFPSGLNGFVTAPFTPGQWVELHRQALIYKHIVASVPVPPYLLFPIHYSNASCYIVDGGGKVVNLGFLLDNPDPEPRRCRRTDGKKWRCSKDSAPDQKYCERHLHRGKPRSRKPVEPPKINSLQNDSNTEKNPRVTQHYNNQLNLNYNDLEDCRYPILNSGLSSVEEETMETRGFIDAWSTEKHAMMTPGGNLASDHELLHDSGLSLSMSHDQIDFGLTDPPFTRANWANQGSSLDGPLGEFFQPHQQLTESATEDPHCPELIDLWNKDYNENLNHTHEISPRESPTRPIISSPSGVLHKTLFSQSDSSNVSSPSFGVFNWHLS